MKSVVLIALITSGWITPLLAQTPVNHVEAVVRHLVGVMDTSAQAEVNPRRVSVHMTTCTIEMVDNSESVYLYQEQALSRNLAQPYRQRVMEILPRGDNQVESKSYRLVNQENWIGLCSQSEGERQLRLADLDEYVCSVFLQPLVTIYLGNTPPEGCPAKVRGAVKITNTIMLHSEGMDTWDRGFDAEGKQVWGAKNEGYEFRWP